MDRSDTQMLYIFADKRILEVLRDIAHLRISFASTNESSVTSENQVPSLPNHVLHRFDRRPWAAMPAGSSETIARAMETSRYHKILSR